MAQKGDTAERKRKFQDIQEEELQLKAQLPADRHCLQGKQELLIARFPVAVANLTLSGVKALATRRATASQPI